MIERAQINGCFSEFISFGYAYEPSDIKIIKWESKAFSATDMKYIDAEGILSIDLIEIVRKEYKLDRYSLDSVSNYFLKETKDDISFKDLMYAYDCYLKNSNDLAVQFAKVGKYVFKIARL